MDHLKVGELARRTGLTVRALHHYDAMGLLTPSRRSSTTSGPGYRLYGAEDVERLTRILLLKSLGLSLDEIQSLAARWQALVEEFTGGDPGIAESVRTVYREEPSARKKTGLDPEIMEYIARAKAAGGEGPGRPPG